MEAHHHLHLQHHPHIHYLFLITARHAAAVIITRYRRVRRGAVCMLPMSKIGVLHETP